MRRLLKWTLLGVTFAWTATGVLSAAEYHATIPGKIKIVGVSPSPTNTTLVVYTIDPNGEDTYGAASVGVIDFTKHKATFSPLRIEVLDSGSDATWLNDGHSFWIAAPDKVYMFDLLDPLHSSKTGALRETLGFALSQDNTRLAFSRLVNSSQEIEIQAPKGVALKKWRVPLKYGSEPYGFQIAFSGNDIIYARTFDGSMHTPLKSFDLSTGRVATVERDCSSVIRSGDTVYFIALSRNHSILNKVSDGEVIKITSLDGYDTLGPTANSRKLALKGRGKSAIFDTDLNRIPESTNCDLMTVLSDETPLYIRNSTISSDKAICRVPHVSDH